MAPQTLTSSDGYSITLGSALGYAVDDLHVLYSTLHDADDTIDSEVASLISSYVGAHSLEECKPRDIETYVRENLKLCNYGLSSQEFYVTNYAKSRTLRIITGEIRGWRHGKGLNTSEFVGDEQK